MSTYILASESSLRYHFNWLSDTGFVKVRPFYICGDGMWWVLVRQ